MRGAPHFVDYLHGDEKSCTHSLLGFGVTDRIYRFVGSLFDAWHPKISNYKCSG